MKYQVEVLVEVDLDLEDLDGENEAFKAVDVVMQRAWDTDQGRHFVKPWHFSMLEGCVSRVVEEPSR